VVSAAICLSHHAKENPTIKDIPRPANRLFARVFFAAVMWWDVIGFGRRDREIVPAPGLRFSPLEIFA
jgi:hypothetical protein